jgi:cytoskeletal protein RodZ
MDIGGELRTARQARKLSIYDIVRATKINPPILRAIESNAFDRIPAGVFTRGYLRAYAREVGLDPDDVVQRFRGEFEVPPESEPGTSSQTVAGSGEEPIGSRHTQIVQIGVIVVVVMACFATLRPSNPTATAEVLPADTASAVPSAAAEVPVGTSGSFDTAKPELTIDIRPHGPCWVEATVDGAQGIARLMDAGDRDSITVRDDLTLRVGDPSAFAFSIDGVEGRPLGREGKPVTVRIDLRNYATFLTGPRG